MLSVFAAVRSSKPKAVARLATKTTAAESMAGEVVAIADGGTITLLVDGQQIKIRLEGIDCPESGQAFGQKAKQATFQLVFGKTVTVRSTGTDGSGRHFRPVTQAQEA